MVEFCHFESLLSRIESGERDPWQHKECAARGTAIEPGWLPQAGSFVFVDPFGREIWMSLKGDSDSNSCAGADTEIERLRAAADRGGWNVVDESHRNRADFLLDLLRALYRVGMPRPARVAISAMLRDRLGAHAERQATVLQVKAAALLSSWPRRRHSFGHLH